MPAIPVHDLPLRSDAVELRLAAERDIPEILIAHQDDPQLHIRLGSEKPPSGAELGRRTERFEAEIAAGTAVTLTIVEPGADDCVGQLNVHKVDWENRRVEIGIWLAPQVRGRGLAAAAIALAARWLFDAWRIERIAMLTEPDNERLLRAARAAGFVEEGIFRSFGVEQGRRIDLAVVSLLPSDVQSSPR